MQPSLLHGDAHQAFVHFFAPVADELAPLDPGFAERRDLWRVPAWLAMVEVDAPPRLG